MKIHNWNSRRPENPCGICILRDLIKKEDPKTMFLHKTKVCSSFVFWKVIFGFDGCLVVDYEGRSNGLALMWKKSIDLSIRHYSKSHIHGFIATRSSGWFTTRVYGQLDASKRRETWDLISSLRNFEGIP